MGMHFFFPLEFSIPETELGLGMGFSKLVWWAEYCNLLYGISNLINPNLEVFVGLPHQKIPI